MAKALECHFLATCQAYRDPQEHVRLPGFVTGRKTGRQTDKRLEDSLKVWSVWREFEASHFDGFLTHALILPRHMYLVLV
jgi:hypothetical protein